VISAKVTMNFNRKDDSVFLRKNVIGARKCNKNKIH